MPEVSVVIPTYNRDQYIKRAIDSALSQTIENIEVIVVDDGSSDRTDEVVERIRDSRITYLKHEANRGGSAARNTGIEYATGEYISFLDSDDEWLPTKLEQQRDELESRSSEWVAAYCDFKRTRSNRLVEIVDNHIRRPTGLEGDEELVARIFLRKFAHGGASTLFVKQHIINEMGGFDPSFQRHQDLEFLVRLLQFGKLAYVDETLIKKHDTGNPSVDAAAQAMEHFNEKFADLIQQLGYHDQVRRTQQFMIAKKQFGEGHFYQGVQSLRGATCPHQRDAFGLFLSLGRGIFVAIDDIK